MAAQTESTTLTQKALLASREQLRMSFDRFLDDNLCPSPLSTSAVADVRLMKAVLDTYESNHPTWSLADAFASEVNRTDTGDEAEDANDGNDEPTANPYGPVIRDSELRSLELLEDYGEMVVKGLQRRIENGATPEGTRYQVDLDALKNATAHRRIVIPIETSA